MMDLSVIYDIILKTIPTIFGVVIGAIIAFLVDKRKNIANENIKIFRKIFIALYVELNEYKENKIGVIRTNNDKSIKEIEGIVLNIFELNIDLLNDNLCISYWNLKYLNNTDESNLNNTNFLTSMTSLIATMTLMIKKYKILPQSIYRDVLEIKYDYQLWRNLTALANDFERATALLEHKAHIGGFDSKEILNNVKYRKLVKEFNTNNIKFDTKQRSDFFQRIEKFILDY